MPTGTLVRKSAIFYGVATAIGLAAMHFWHQSLEEALAIPPTWAEGLRFAAVGVVGAGLLLVISYFFEDWFPSFRELKSFVVRLLGPVSAPTAIYLAVLSSVGEELLFRGAIQPLAGLWMTSVLFGLLHMGPGALSAWSLWAMLAGLLLGWMYDETHSLWPPLIAHFGVNAVSILNLRRAWRALEAHLAAERRRASLRPNGPSSRDDG